jgi:hypothetical protein
VLTTDIAVHADIRLRLAEPASLDYRLDDVSLGPGWRKPFDPVSIKRNVPKGLYLKKVGLKGFEPSTSASRTQRSSQAELQPVAPQFIRIT